MNKWQNVKDKQRLVLYTIAGGYIFYQGITLFSSVIKNGDPFSKNLIFYIFSALFVLCGSAIFYYVIKNYRKQLNEMKMEQQKEQQMESTEEFKSEELEDKNDNEQ